MAPPARAKAPALPRALNVEAFVGAREKELRSLLTAAKRAARDEARESGESERFAAGALTGLLRRRTAGHNPYALRRRPNLKLKRRAEAEAERTARERGEEGGGDEAEARDEAGRGTGGAASTSGAAAEGAALPPPAPAAWTRPTNRRMRRTKRLLSRASLEQCAWREDDASPNAERGRARRLEAHVFLAKRVKMSTFFGNWRLPAGQAGRGRGTRGLLRAGLGGCVLHDRSYLCPLAVDGTSMEETLRALSALVDDEDLRRAEAQLPTARLPGGGSPPPGEDEGSEADGANAAGVIPTGLERQVVLTRRGREGEGSRAIGRGLLTLLPPSSALLWVHPALAPEAADALRSGSGAPGPSPSASVRVADLRRLELRGARWTRALTPALGPAAAARIEEEERLAHQGPRPDTLEIQIRDPRLDGVPGLGPGGGSPAREGGGRHGGDGDGDGDGDDRARGDGAARLPRWRRVAGAPGPAPQRVVGEARAAARAAALGLDDGAGPAATPAAPAGLPACAASAPAFLVLVKGERAPGICIPGCSLIVPAGWTPALTESLALRGALLAGQREWRQLSAAQGMAPCPCNEADGGWATGPGETFGLPDPPRSVRPEDLVDALIRPVRRGAVREGAIVLSLGADAASAPSPPWSARNAPTLRPSVGRGSAGGARGPARAVRMRRSAAGGSPSDEDEWPAMWEEEGGNGGRATRGGPGAPGPDSVTPPALAPEPEGGAEVHPARPDLPRPLTSPATYALRPVGAVSVAAPRGVPFEVAWSRVRLAPADLSASLQPPGPGRPPEALVFVRNRGADHAFPCRLRVADDSSWVGGDPC